jgi:FKBP-type peptidyl-prolyl isomerase-like protein
MRSNRFRPVVELLETRLTPSINGDLGARAIETMVNSAFVAFADGSHDWMADPANAFDVQDTTQAIFAQSALAIETFGQARESLQADLAANPGRAGFLIPMIAAVSQFQSIAQANYSFAQSIASWQRFDVELPPPLFVPSIPPPPEPETPDDSGMVNTMPNVNDSNWVTGANGLKTWDVVVGTGTPAVAAGNNITVFYSGWLASNGTLFDSRRSPAAPANFDLDNLIQGWKLGVPGMREGGIRRLFIPAALGYGAAGSPPNVPANADLVFEIKLVAPPTQ